MPLLIFILGLCVGSFLNVLADRLPNGESVLWGRSHCDYCKKTLRWYELVPVLSFIFLRGRCLRCHKPLSIQYPVVELLTGLGFVFLSPRIDYMIIFCTLLVLFLSDLKYQILPDSMIVIGSLAAILHPHILPALGSFAFLYLLWAITRGRGMGLGDVKLALFMGLFLGYPDIIVAFYIAFLTGALLGVILILVGKKGLKSTIAFGPFLIVGTALAFLWGQNILTALHL
jgi:leader peptidase (prepilin peptidase)/N-methyltransferase